ncbi:antitoxin Xre-like helix-turn-helix domain-containing protein [Ensifer soli]|uniref:antitoxin Xre-like helix-turn-helix domain-containing protein n=1 Tax=Ciceribacter sp. sgz301302 TaxID=3342379 RepID=UPI0035BAB64D
MAALASPLPAAAAPDRDEDAVVIRAIARAFALWKLTNQESAALFDVPLATWNRMKAGAFKGRLDRDKTMRASLILGIFKGLRLYFDGPLTYGWPKGDNGHALFAGRSPLRFMIEGGIPAMLSTRRYIDGLRGGL